MPKYLVTVRGQDHSYTPSEELVTKTITLKEGDTPIHWFMSKPTVYSRFYFIPNVLVNFWKIE